MKWLERSERKMSSRGTAASVLFHGMEEPIGEGCFTQQAGGRCLPAETPAHTLQRGRGLPSIHHDGEGLLHLYQGGPSA